MPAQFRTANFPWNFFDALAATEDFANGWYPLGLYVSSDKDLEPAHRELVILRVAQLSGADYLRAQHTPIATALGVSAADIARAAQGPDAPGWTPLTQGLVRATDELFAHQCISDATLATLGQSLDRAAVIKVVATVGLYMLNAMFVQTFAAPESGGTNAKP